MAPQYQGLHGLSSQILQLGGQGPRTVHFRHVWDNGLLLDFATDSRLKNDSEGPHLLPGFPDSLVHGKKPFLDQMKSR